jgi:hypothetical protein
MSAAFPRYEAAPRASLMHQSRGQVEREGSVLVTSTVRGDLSGSPWHNRLQPVSLTRRGVRFTGLEVYRLSSLSGLSSHARTI